MITAPWIISLLLALLACVPQGQGGLTAAISISNAWDMPPLDLQDPEGQRHTLHDWHGKVILLNFWASWCGPCQAEVPDLVRYQREYAGQGLQVIGVGLDELSRIRNFIRTFGINYPVLVSDPSRGHELLPRWGDPRQILPFTVVIGRDGHMHFMQVGPLGEEAFADYVLPLLNASPPYTQHEKTAPRNADSEGDITSHTIYP